MAAEIAAPAPTATSIRLSASAVSIGVKETYTGLRAISVPDDSALPAVTWRSKNKKIARVNAEGHVTGVKTGTTYVYAKMADGNEVSCKVKVRKAPKKVYLRPGRLALSAEGMTAHLTVSLTQKSASGSLTWTSSDESVAVVDASGKVTALKDGSATIRVTSFNGKSDTCKVTVSAAPAKVVLSGTAFTIGVGQKLALEAEAHSADGKAAPVNLRYSSSSACATVDADSGEITGAKKGTATVTASAHNGKKARCTVTVLAAPAGITLSAAKVNIGVKEMYAGLTAALTPPAGEEKCAGSITWTTSNRKVARVDAEGHITGVKKGTATITATTHNGKSVSCRVKVRKAPKKVCLRPGRLALSAEGMTAHLTVSLTQKSASGSLTWTSSDESVAVVDASGKVTALKKGIATITATTYNGKKAKSTLTVYAASVSLPIEEYETLASTTSTYSPDMSNSEKLEYVIYVAQNQMGKPYNWGSNGPDKYDCSGFTQYCFRQIGIKLERSAYTQGYDRRYEKIHEPKDLKRGDLVFFNTNDRDADLSDHAALYLGNGYFIHASSSAKKVIISQFVSKSSNYYLRNFSWGYRVLK